MSAVIGNAPSGSVLPAGVPDVAVGAFIPPRRVAVVVLGARFLLVLVSAKRLWLFILVLALGRRVPGRHKRGRHEQGRHELLTAAV